MERASRPMSRRYASMSSCPEANASVLPLKVRGNTQGLGNRVGWYLTVAALADALGRPAVFTSWPNVVKAGFKGAGARDYDWPAIDGAIAWPSVLRFLEDDSESTAWLRAGEDAVQPRGFREGGNVEPHAEPIPYHPRPYVNDYVPECAWEMVTAWARRRLTRLPVDCLNRAAFLQSYQRVQAQLRPKVPLCNPRSQSYIVLHMRRGDKAEWAKGGRRSSLSDALANATALEAVIGNALLPIAQATDLPVLLLTDGGPAYKSWAEQTLTSAGLRLARGVDDHPYCTAVAAAASDGSAATATATVPAVMTHASTVAAATPNTAGGRHRAVLADFFAILDAAGVVVIAPKGAGAGQGLQESSFASVAALAGGAPHLTPVPYGIGGKMALYQQKGNGGQPMRGIYFLDNLAAYIRRVRHNMDPLGAHRSSP